MSDAGGSNSGGPGGSRFPWYLSELRLWVRDVGFPVVVALLLLLRLDAGLHQLVQGQAQLSQQLIELLRQCAGR